MRRGLLSKKFPECNICTWTRWNPFWGTSVTKDVTPSSSLNGIGSLLFLPILSGTSLVVLTFRCPFLLCHERSLQFTNLRFPISPLATLSLYPRTSVFPTSLGTFRVRDELRTVKGHSFVLVHIRRLTSKTIFDRPRSISTLVYPPTVVLVFISSLSSPPSFITSPLTIPKNPYPDLKILTLICRIE